MLTNKDKQELNGEFNNRLSAYIKLLQVNAGIVNNKRENYAKDSTIGPLMVLAASSKKFDDQSPEAISAALEIIKSRPNYASEKQSKNFCKEAEIFVRALKKNKKNPSEENIAAASTNIATKITAPAELTSTTPTNKTAAITSTSITSTNTITDTLTSPQKTMAVAAKGINAAKQSPNKSTAALVLGVTGALVKLGAIACLCTGNPVGYIGLSLISKGLYAAAGVLETKAKNQVRPPLAPLQAVTQKKQEKYISPVTNNNLKGPTTLLKPLENTDVSAISINKKE